jgi:nucleoid-associated protein YgaU
MYLRFSFQGVIMKILSFILVLLTFLLYNCSSSDVEKEKSEKELVSEVEQSLDDKSAEAPNKEDELFFEEKPPVEAAIPAAEEPSSEPVSEVAEQPVEKPAEVKITEAGEYVVEKGDTLLLISFKVYGDYRKWRQIIGENPGVSQKNLRVGTKIKYTLPNSPFDWNKNGNAHLILKGETLGTISNEHYGTLKRWKEIYENNQPMILDPNLIFAGFTLFYVPDKVAKN